MPADPSSGGPAGLLGHEARPLERGADAVIPAQRDAADRPPWGAAQAPEASRSELVERLAEELYNNLDPRFVDWEWKDATEGAREWARARAQRLLAARWAEPAGERASGP